MDDFIRDFKRKTKLTDGNIVQTFIEFIAMWNIEDDCKAHFAETAGWVENSEDYIGED